MRFGSVLNYIILLKLLQLLQEASLISYRLVKERKKKVTQMILLHYDHEDGKGASLWEVHSAA